MARGSVPRRIPIIRCNLLGGVVVRARYRRSPNACHRLHRILLQQQQITKLDKQSFRGSSYLCEKAAGLPCQKME